MADPATVASVRQRLVNASKKLGIQNEILMRRYAFERLLGRLAGSDHHGELCLKGAMAFLAVTGDFARPTKDMDFTGMEAMPSRDMLEIWRGIAALAPGEDDGLDFLVESFEAEDIQAGTDEPGTRVIGEARLGTSRIPLKIEVSYGHALTPGAQLLDYPTILDGSPTARILCYSKETMLAEKFEAICSLGDRTSRFKDFYDICGLARKVEFDGEVAAEAFRNTFGRRGTELPETDPACLTPDFETVGQRGWSAFQRKQGIRDQQNFAQLIAEIRPLVMGVAALARGQDGPLSWRPGEGWTDERPDGPEARNIVPF